MMPLLNTAVMAIFASRSRSRRPCPLIDILADNRYFRYKHSLKGKEEADSSSFAIICLSIVRTTDSC